MDTITAKSETSQVPRNHKLSKPKKRLQLFDLSTKARLLKLCENELVQLTVENVRKGCPAGNINERNVDNLLDFDGSSSSDEDEAKSRPAGEGEAPESLNLLPSTGHARLHCGSCQVSFSNMFDQRQHYTLDWHRYNIKRKLLEQLPVSEVKFDEMMDDLSSIEGSEDEEEEEPVERLMEKLEMPSTNSSGQKPQKLTEVIQLSSSQKFENSPKVFFRNNDGEIITCYKTILLKDMRRGSESLENPKENFLTCLKKPLKITIVMTSGGHFAAAMFDGNTCISHKTFHSYTVRAKQGGAQGGRDAKSGTSNPSSAGASLRRYNEQSFQKHIQDLLTSWKDSIEKSDFVFYRAISWNANILLHGKNPPLNKEKKNLRTIPFPTKRPTFSEVKRVHSLLTTLHVYESVDDFLAAHSQFGKKSKVSTASPDGSPSKKGKKQIHRSKSRSPKRKDDLDIPALSDMSNDEENGNQDQELVDVDQVVDLTELKEYDDSLTAEERSQKKRSKKSKAARVFKAEGLLGDLAKALQQPNGEGIRDFEHLLKSKEQSEPLDLNKPIDSQQSTLLHLASKSNYLQGIWSLLDAGCDPSLKDKLGKYPYNYATTRESRDTFRTFLGDHPDKYDYQKAQIPPPLTKEQEQERIEKKKIQNKLKRDIEKQKKKERKELEKETEEQTRYLNLSDREKRALAAEQRILAQCKRNAEKAPVLIRCFECAIDITGKVPFEYNQNVFCTTKCLAAHRKKFPCPLSV